MNARLFYFQCSLCQTLATSPVFSPRYACVVCQRWLRFLYAVDVTTDEQRQLVARGLVFNPHRVQPQPWTCVRCGTTFRDLRPTYRPDGKCCRDCSRAEAVPMRLLTPDEQETDKAERASRAQQDQDRMEAAYRALESQQEN